MCAKKFICLIIKELCKNHVFLTVQFFDTTVHFLYTILLSSLHYPSVSVTHSSSFPYSYSLFYGSSRIWRDRSVICSLQERVVEHIWQGFHKNKQNPRYIYRVFDLLSLQVKSYESKLSPTLPECKAVARCATR